MDLERLLADLAQKRPVFHSEADFQHALAWEVHKAHPEAEVRLEYRPAFVPSRMYIDLWIVIGGEVIAVELKYKTRRLTHQHNGELFELLDQSAQDTGRYDFLKDISRLERVTSTNPAVKGVAVLLTNDSTYWSLPRSQESVDFDFRIHEGRSLRGQMAWGPGASAGTMRSRETPIELVAEYTTGWQNYSVGVGGRNASFRYLLVHVTSL